MRPKLSDSTITDAIFDAMLALDIKHMPSLRELNQLGEYTSNSRLVNGHWLALTIKRTGGSTYWKRTLRLLSKLELDQLKNNHEKAKPVHTQLSRRY